MVSASWCPNIPDALRKDLNFTIHQLLNQEWKLRDALQHIKV